MICFITFFQDENPAVAEDASGHSNINAQIIDSIDQEEGQPKDSPGATKCDGDPAMDIGYHPPPTDPKPQTSAFSPSSQSSHNPTKQASLMGGPVVNQDHLRSSSIDIECDVSN